MPDTTPPEPPVALRALADYASVQTWLDGLKQHWGGDPATDDPDRLPMLKAFCVYANRDPDQIIKETTMVKDGEKRIRVKGRERYARCPKVWIAGDLSDAAMVEDAIEQGLAALATGRP